jgi:uncharacterized protein YwgA
MANESWQWLAAIIAGHPNHEVFGRTRLQKTVWLLQRLGMPTEYVYSLHFYGPYSEEVKADIALATQLEVITETPKIAQDGTEYFILSAKRFDVLPALGRLKIPVDLLAAEDSVILELAATYDAFREMGLSHEAAVESLRAKKGDKCGGDRERRALDLLQRLNLETAAA